MHQEGKKEKKGVARPLWSLETSGENQASPSLPLSPPGYLSSLSPPALLNLTNPLLSALFICPCTIVYP